MRDADEDGDSDIVVAELGSMHILFGDGAGSFGGDLGEVDVPLPVVDDVVVPIQVEHIDDDGRLDFVDSNVVWTTAGGCADYEACRFTASGVFDGPGGLREAVVADVTGDGRHDVIGVVVDDDEQSATRSALALVLAASNGVYAFDVIPTPTPARDLWVADFDGDGVEDVAMIAPSAERCVVPDRIAVLFGEVAQEPTLVETAEIQGIEAIAAGPIVPFGNRFDGAGDLGLTTSCPPSTRSSGFAASILYGNPDRGFDSPVKLAGAGEQGEYLQFATGRVQGGDDHPDLVAVGPADSSEGDLLLWAIRATGDADLDPDTSPPMETGLFGDPFAIAAGDFDCRADGTGVCGTDEVVVFQPWYSDREGLGSDEPRLALVKSPAEVTLSPDCSTVAGPRYDGEEIFASALAHDVDGDGWLDVVAWWTTLPGQPVRGAAWVYFHDGVSPVNACPVLIEIPDGELVFSVASIDVGEGDPALVLATGGARLLRPGTARDLAACKDGGSACSSLPVDPTATDVAVMDFDLDGLDDLAVTTSRGLEIQLQKSLDVVLAQANAGPDD